MSKAVEKTTCKILKTFKKQCCQERAERDTLLILSENEPQTIR